MMFTTNPRLEGVKPRKMAKTKDSVKARKIKQVVRCLVIDKGFHAVSMREIGKAADMNHASLYYYYENKEEILFSLMNEAMDEVLEALEGILAADLSPVEKLNEMIGFYSRHYGKERKALTLMVDGMQSLGKRHYRIIIEKQKRYVHMIRSILEELAAEKKMKAMDATLAGYAFLGLVHYGLEWYHKDVPAQEDGRTQGFADIFLKGILKG